MRATAIRRVLLVTHSCYLDDSSGAAVSCRDMMQALARRGFAVEVLCGTMFDLGQEFDPATWLARRDQTYEAIGGRAWVIDAIGVHAEDPLAYRLTVRGVPITMHRSPTTRPHDPEDGEHREFLRLFDAVMSRFQPDVLVSYGGSRLIGEVLARARSRGVATLFSLHNFNYHTTTPFAHADAVRVPSQFAADSYRRTLGLHCTVLPNLFDLERALVEQPRPKYATFVNPSIEKGVYAFARIADELGRRRPDIPLLVVEGRGTEATLAGCGLDLRAHGNVFLMDHTSDPREFWGVTRVCLMPSLWWESQPRVAVEAMVNGIPVIGSDRGGIPETLGSAGIVLPLPDRLTPKTRILPTAEEVAPWVEAVIRLWDDSGFYDDHRRLALAEAERWHPDRLEPLHVGFFENLRPGMSPFVDPANASKA